ncbi:hypothetical protein A1O3_04046 [Capronia epimyces CBS 606.96]|uniref:Luciferase-like domain-containing protein n=1 Tax=Capronia epimyces CBS 606.96 TaxID=1182542 RepID=W9Y3L1_9EURO|nr:uncharacterized protein A1O3_04046 [Capronia epimyces CBS 606.96]EXJ87088.1 hypothetical protein A1O3_04046 [Capronia epimyces CBS 606.96]
MGSTGASQKQWVMNAFAMSSPGHVAAGLWRHPQNRSQEYLNLGYWIDLARILEEGKFNGLFIADMLGIYDVYQGPGNINPVLPGAAQFPISDPFPAIAAMAAVTTSLAFGITSSTTYEHPFALARRFSTLDHLTRGRVGWNIVTSYLESAAKNFGLDTQVPHDTRYAKAEEYLNVTYKLWEGSWRDDAVVQDPKTKQYTVPGRVRRIDHEGEWFKSAGPHTVEPSPQRTPFIFQAGTSSAGKVFATKHAEAMFLPGMEPHVTRKAADSIRKLAVEIGRNPDSIKLLAGIIIIVDETDEKAQAKYEEYLSYADDDGTLALFGGWYGVDISQWGDDEDFRFAPGFPGAVQGMLEAWSSTVPGGKNIKWTKSRIARELALGGPHAKAIGSPETVADILQHWIDEANIDGFNISYAISPGNFQDIIKYLFPELRRRGVFWDDYAVPGGTARENYSADGKGPRVRADHPASRFRWRAGEEVPEYAKGEVDSVK